MSLLSRDIKLRIIFSFAVVSLSSNFSFIPFSNIFIYFMNSLQNQWYSGNPRADLASLPRFFLWGIFNNRIDSGIPKEPNEILFKTFFISSI